MLELINKSMSRAMGKELKLKEPSLYPIPSPVPPNTSPWDRARQGSEPAVQEALKGLGH